MSRSALLSAVALALAFTSIPSEPIRAADPKKIDVLVSPSGSGPYLAWATLQNYAPRHTDKIAPVAVETPGFTYNARFMAQSPDKWKTTVFGSGQVVEWAAANGVKPFFPEPLEVAKDFRVIGVMSQTSNFFVTTDEAIDSPADFAGKRVATGLLTQNEWGMHHRMLLDAWGLTEQLDSFNALGSNENINALLDGRADVGALVVHSALDFSHNLEPQPFRSLESAGRPWHYVSIPEDMLKEYIQKEGAPFLVRKIPAGTLTNQKEDLVTFGNFMTLSAHKDFPEDLAYELAKLWIEMGPSLGEYSAIARIWDPRSISELARQAPEKIHPGAMRAYREAGLVK